GAGALDCVLDPAEEIGTLDPARADGEAEALAEAGGLRAAERLDRGFHQPIADVEDQARILGDGDEAGRERHGDTGAVPADQRLAAREQAGAGADARLEADLELALLERLAERSLGRGFLLGRGGERALVPLGARSAAALGVVH